MAAVTKVGKLSLSDSTRGSHNIQLLKQDCDTSILHIPMLTTPLTAGAAPQEEQAFNSSDGVELTTKLHKQDITSTEHTYELTDDDDDDEEDDSHFYDDLDFGSGKKIHQQQKLCVSSRESPAGGPTARKRGSCLGTSADTTPLDKILGSLESMLPKYIRDSGRVCDILTHQEEPQQQQTARRDHRKKILDIDRLITQCYGHLLSSDGEGDYYHHDEENGGDQGDASQPARHLESIKIDIDRVISKCGLLSAVGDDEKMKRMTEDIPDILRVSRENCNATLYDSLRSLETFLPSYHADCQYSNRFE